MKDLIISALACVFVMSLAFIMGQAWTNQQWKERIYQWDCNDLNNFYSNSSWKYQEGHKLDLPEEISQLEVYDCDSVDLMASFIDDVGDIRFLYTGKKYPSDSLLLTR